MSVDGLQRSEFLWNADGPSAAHAHVMRPVVLQLDRFDARSVLDLGCGNGWFTSALVRCGFDATGLDTSASGIAIATREHPDIGFRRCDATQPLPSDLIGGFDAVVAIEVLDHTPAPRALLRQAISALRPGGLLIATVPYHGYMKNLGLALSARFDTRWHALQDHGRLKFYSRRTLLALLRDARLQHLHFETIGRVPPIARSMLVAGRTLSDA